MTDTQSTLTPECIGSQTVGPYYAIGLEYLVSDTLAGPLAAGRHVTIAGTVFDADGEPVPDAILELWQASPEGAFTTEPYLRITRTPETFSGFVRLSTHQGGRFQVHTVVPGPVPYVDERMQAPHIVVLLFMRGLMRYLVTRIYFAGEPANEQDPVLQLLPEHRRSTLFAQADQSNPNRLVWDIHLRGDKETVFFAC